MKKGALAVGSTLVAWMLLEVVSLGIYWWVHREPFSRERIRNRWVAASPAPLPGNTHDGNLPPHVTSKRLHPFLGFAVDPNHPLGNEYGFYGPPPLFESSAERVIVGVFGGSVALGLVASAGDILKRELRASPKLQGRSIGLVCLAVDGFKQPQTLISLAYLLSVGAQFDVVVNLDGFNDVVLPYTENQRAGVPLSYPRSWNQYSQGALNVDRVRVLARMDRTAGKIQWLQSRALRFPCSSSVFCMTLADGLRRRWQSELAGLDVQLRERSRVTNNEAGQGTSTSDRDFLREAARQWQRASFSMDALCRAHGIRYFHFLQPNQYVRGSKTLTQAEMKAAFIEGPSRLKVAVPLGYPFLIEDGKRLSAAQVGFFDLTRLFAAERRTLYPTFPISAPERPSSRLRVVNDQNLSTFQPRNKRFPSYFG